MRLSPAALLLVALTSAQAGSPPLQPDARGAASPDRSFDLIKLTLDVEIDPAARQLEGFGRYELRRLGEGPLVLDQVALDVREVKVDGTPATWRTEGDALVIEVPGARGSNPSVEVRWTARPRTGLHFREAGAGSSDTFDHVWTQGEGEDNRHWFPGWDHPNDRFAYVGTVRTPAGWKAITNSNDDLVNYLIMLAAGDYEVFGQAPYTVWAARGTPAEQVRPLLDPLPAMMSHFAERTGVVYPWPEYRQVVVERFLYTAMENTTATVNAAVMLRPPALAETSRWVESVVAHELAHHWFGDLLTCHGWREMWLNEGFATFMAADWMTRVDGPATQALAVRGWYAASQSGPALVHHFHQGEDAPPFHNPYNKGASVLQMLRVHLGEEVFWEGIRRYVTDNQRRLVRTDDLREAMEQVSGQELGWFFQQWVELPYVPKLTVKQRYVDGLLTVTVRQQIDDARPRYTLPVELEIGTADGPITRRVWLEDEDVEVHVPVVGAPSYVAFDPRGGVLASVDHEQDPAAWAAQTRSASPYARLVALAALGETDQAEPLVAVLIDERAHPGERAAAAEALGAQRGAEPLLPFARVAHDGVREAVATALGQTTGRDAAPTLAGLARQDPNTDVRAAALRSLGRLDPDAGLAEARRALKVQGRSAEPLREAAADLLGEHGVKSDLALLLDPKLPVVRRGATLMAAVRVAERSDEGDRAAARARVARAAEGLLVDLDQRQRELAVRVLAEVGDARSVDALEAFRRQETIADLQDAAREAADTVRGRLDRPEGEANPNDVDARLEALERRLDEAEAELERWQERH